MEEPINANIELLHGETDMGSSSAVTRYLENTVHLNSRYYIPDRQAVSCAVLMSNLMRGRFFLLIFLIMGHSRATVQPTVRFCEVYSFQSGFTCSFHILSGAV